MEFSEQPTIGSRTSGELLLKICCDEGWDKPVLSSRSTVFAMAGQSLLVAHRWKPENSALCWQRQVFL